MEVKQEKVQHFFDELAGGWDSSREVDGDKLRGILDLAGVAPGCRVLDVACGTGVLFPFYLERKVSHVTGVDLSPEMIRLAAEKCRDERLTLIAGDVERLALGEFDCVVILNALPHFPDPRGLLAHLAGCLVPGGRLTVAHDRSRHAINGHHGRTASEVSLGLPPAAETAAWVEEILRVDVVIEDETKYVVSGTRQ